MVARQDVDLDAAVVKEDAQAALGRVNMSVLVAQEIVIIHAMVAPMDVQVDAQADAKFLVEEGTNLVDK